MRRIARLSACAVAPLIVASAAVGAYAQFVPPAGYSSGGARVAPAVPSDPDAPPLTRIADATVADLIQIDPAYRRRSPAAHAKIVGTFAIAKTGSAHVVAAWAPGFLPVSLSFNDGRCYRLSADYENGTLSNGRLNKPCETRRTFAEPAVPAPPPGSALRFVGKAWGYGAWVDDRAHTTIITAPGATAFQPFLTARMTTIAMMAMNGPDWPGGNVTLVGRIKGRLTVVTLEVGY